MDGVFPLFAAAGAGYAELVADLIHHGATVDLQTNTGATALHHAVRSSCGLIVNVVADFARQYEGGRNTD